MHGQKLPWSEDDLPTHQNNAYGWSKRVNECQFINSTIEKTIGLRFFTVYGPYGRPDMALFLFADAIANGTEMTLYNKGQMKRDFTYVGDIVSGIECVVRHITNQDAGTKFNEIYNIGFGKQVDLLDFVSEIERQFGRSTTKRAVDAHPADTPETWANITKIKSLGYHPKTPVSEGVREFVEWYKQFYGVN
jgi:UDP-glucuronate 4-epimerase